MAWILHFVKSRTSYTVGSWVESTHVLHGNALRCVRELQSRTTPCSVDTFFKHRFSRAVRSVALERIPKLHLLIAAAFTTQTLSRPFVASRKIFPTVYKVCLSDAYPHHPLQQNGCRNMFAGKTSKSLEYYPSSSTGGADAKGTLRKSQSYAHRRRSSSIPKPSPEAPLFRNDPLDRFCSKIPYPKTKGNLYYDILTGEQRWRQGKPMNQPSRGSGLTHLLTRRVTAHQEPTEETVDEHDGPISIVTGTSNPSSLCLADITSNRDSACSKFAEGGHPHASSASEISRFSTRRLYNASLSSQNTVLEYGSEMTDYMDELENLGDDHPESHAASETSCDTSLDDLMCVKNEAVRFAPTLPSNFWQGCGVERAGHGRAWNVDLTRVALASEVHATDIMDDRGHGRQTTLPPSSTTSAAATTRQAMFYKLGRFRRRPQIPVSEATDIEDDDDLTEGDGAMYSAKKLERKRSFTKVVVDLFGDKSSSLTTDPSTARSEDSVSDASLCVMTSGNSSQTPSRKHTPRFEHYDWFPRDSSKKSNVLEMTVPEKPSQGNAVCHSRAGWIRAALGFSCKALLVFSVTALGHFLRDRQEEEEDLDNPDEHKEVMTDLDDLEAHHLSLSDYALASPVGPTTYSYPLSLLDSLSDSDTC